MAEPVFFASQAAWRAWLEKHHADEREVTLGFWKKASGKGGITPDQALDEALCFGWIDGVRHSLNDEAFTNRYTPRTKRSYWSRVNMAKYEKLQAAGRVHPAGRAAFEARDPARDAEYSSEAREGGLSEEFEAELRANAAAWAFWSKQPPGYRKTAAFWVMSAKREDTRRRRLATLIEDSASGRRIELLRPGRATNE
jgi:uncharacterized protein YdeI (YjbR/CyaY-like superfamily)